MTTPNTAAAQWRPPDLTGTVIPSAQGAHGGPHDQIDGFPEVPESTVMAAVTMLRSAADLCEAARKLLLPISRDAASQASAASDAAVAASNVADGLNWT